MEYADLFEKYLPFWNTLSGVQQKYLCENTSSRVYKKGTNVHGNGGVCTGAVFVREGCLRVYLLSEEGKEVTLYRLYAGDICMLTASCVIAAIDFDVFVDAEKDSDVFIINPQTFAQLSAENLSVENFGLNIVARRFSEVMWAMQQILFRSFDCRLASFLCKESDQSGSLCIFLTHEQIAKYLGSAREVVTRMLHYFSEEGLVRLERGRIELLDIGRLRLYAD